MQLRRNHHKRRGGLSIFRMVLFVLLLLLILYLLYNSINNRTIIPENDGGYEVTLNESLAQEDLHFLPKSNGEIIIHQNFTLSYREDHEQAEWVAYNLTEDMLRKPNVKRSKKFTKDEKVVTGSAGYYDYRGTGYTRGHLVPAGDMAHDKIAMRETFNMSNISPQVRAFNNGIWKELEEQVRDWVFHNDELYIISGPILADNLTEHISNKKISIPKRFYKIVFDHSGEATKAIAFVIPHNLSEEPLRNFAVTIDSVESITGINFFQGLNIDKVESEIKIEDWDFSDSRFKLRVNQWNNQ